MAGWTSRAGCAFGGVLSPNPPHHLCVSPAWMQSQVVVALGFMVNVACMRIQATSCGTVDQLVHRCFKQEESVNPNFLGQPYSLLSCERKVVQQTASFLNVKLPKPLLNDLQDQATWCQMPVFYVVLDLKA
eukprot:CAMPEP_0172906934 /NCGR_PEP_ID=MMETSP1075-20121228/177828_1 /TAXON_ID=2916 /ORGANISM="Ceratium fusus, Strain PA161109" /LENGTH=130 /DNA_ID=CAMNT_0013764457 /DNA_START=1295 /DNA_END=1688 /DNA_ORIENTATION=-